MAFLLTSHTSVSPPRVQRYYILIFLSILLNVFLLINFMVPDGRRDDS